MPRRVIGGLIQAAAPLTDPSDTHREDPAGGDRRASAAHRGGRQARRPDPRPAGDLQRPVLLPVAGRALVRHRRAGAGPDDRADGARTRKKYRWRWSCRSTSASRRASTTTPPPSSTPTARYLGKYRKNHIPHTSGFWEKYFFKPGNLGYPGLQDAVRHDRRLHLLRPPLPRGRAAARPERRRDRLQPVGDRRRAVAVSVEARAAGARGRQRLLHGVQQPRRHRGAVEHRPVLRLVVLRRSARQVPGDRLGGQDRAGRRRDGSRHDRRGPARLAVLSRPPARDLRRRWRSSCHERCSSRNGTIVTATDQLQRRRLRRGRDDHRDRHRAHDGRGSHHRRHRQVRASRRHRRPHASRHAVRRHHVGRRLRVGHDRRRARRHDDDRRLRDSVQGPDAAPRVGNVDEEGRGQGRDRLRLPHDHHRAHRPGRAGDGRAGRAGRHLVQAVHGLSRRVHAGRCHASSGRCCAPGRTAARSACTPRTAASSTCW